MTESLENKSCCQSEQSYTRLQSRSSRRHARLCFRSNRVDLHLLLVENPRYVLYIHVFSPKYPKHGQKQDVASNLGLCQVPSWLDCLHLVTDLYRCRILTNQANKQPYLLSEVLRGLPETEVQRQLGFKLTVRCSSHSYE